MHWVAPTEKDTANETLEKRLWAAADQFRANSGFKAVQLLKDVTLISASMGATVHFVGRMQV